MSDWSSDGALPILVAGGRPQVQAVAALARQQEAVRAEGAALAGDADAAHVGALVDDARREGGDHAVVGVHRAHTVGAEHAQAGVRRHRADLARSEEHTSELQSLMRISYAVFCLKK